MPRNERAFFEKLGRGSVALYNRLVGRPESVTSEQAFYFHCCLAAVSLLLCYIAKIDVLSLQYAVPTPGKVLCWITILVCLCLYLAIAIRLVRLFGQLPQKLARVGVSVMAVGVMAAILVLCPLAPFLSLVGVLLLGLAVLLFQRRWALLSILALLTPVTGAAASVWRFLSTEFGEEAAQASFELVRVTNLASGVSPLVAVSCLTVVLILWGFTQLKRLGLQRQFAMGNPLPATGSASFICTQRADKTLRTALARPMAGLSAHTWFWIANIVLVVMLWRIALRFVPTVESRAFDCFFLAGFAVATLLVAVTILHFLLLWVLVRKLLRQLVRLPMVKAYDRLPPRISSLFGRYLNFLRPRLSQLVVPVHQVGLLAQAFPGAHADLAKHCDAATIDQLQTLLFPAARTRSIPEIYQKESQTTNDFARIKGKTQQRLGQLSRLCGLVLERFWHQLAVNDAFGTDPAKEAAKDKEEKDDGIYPLVQPAKASPLSADTLHWLRLAEDFLAMRIVAYLVQFFVHLRTFVEMMVVGSLLLVLVAASYTFQPQRLLLIFTTSIVAVIAGLIVIFFVQIDRDELASHISRTIPNRLTIDRALFTNMITYVVPLVFVLIGQLFNLQDLLGPWLEPLLRVLK
jgi:hypothetical protein